MGIVFGVTGVEEPAHTVLKTYQTPMYFEVRRNPQYFIAEAPMQEGEDSSFSLLAKYIGVFGKPENEAAQAMAMTAPVITQPKGSVPMAMTAPVIETPDKMSFVLPFHFTDISQIPIPKDKRVEVKAIPSKVIAVSKFRGWYSPKEGVKQFQKLAKALKDHQLVDPAADLKTLPWSVAQYHPPFTLPFFRRNEIWVEIQEEAVRAEEK